jgi:hypothetical protein
MRGEEDQKYFATCVLRKLRKISTKSSNYAISILKTTQSFSKVETLVFHTLIFTLYKPRVSIKEYEFIE